MIWPPQKGPVKRPDRAQDASANGSSDRAPLPEPPITADPLVLRESLAPTAQGNDSLTPSEAHVDNRVLIRPSLPPDLPPPLVMPDPVSEADGDQASTGGTAESNAE